MSAGGARRLTWVVGPADEGCLRRLLARIPGASVDAVAAGRVFVDGRRTADTGQPLRAGQRLEVYPPRAEGSKLEVLDERGGLIAVNKPADMPTEPDRRGTRASLVYQLATRLGLPPRTLHAASRLDLGVSGVVLVARTAAARRAVCMARDQDRLVHRYVAISVRAPESEHGAFTAPISRRKRRGAGHELCRAVTRFAVVGQADSRSAPWRVADSDASPALLALEPATGRTHQIRLHAAGAGTPLLGDRAHGGPTRLLRRDGEVIELSRIALHAAGVRLTDERGSWQVDAPLPDLVAGWWRVLGGADELMESALHGGPL